MTKALQDLDLQRAAGDRATGAGQLYHMPEIDLSPFGGLLADLRLESRALAGPAEVDITRARIFLLPARALALPSMSQAVVDLRGVLSTVIVVGSSKDERQLTSARLRDAIFAWLREPLEETELRYALRNSLRHIELQEQTRRIQADLDRRTSQMADLHRVGIAISAERDLDALQRLILTKGRELTGADAGSLYLVVEEEETTADANGEPMRDGEGNAIVRRVKMLSFNKAQNFSNPSDFKAFKMPIDRGIAGYVATTGNVVQHDDMYHLPPGVPYSFNTAVDKQTGYRTKSMLTVPMVNSDNEIIGVIQLINRKRQWETRLTLENVEQEVLPFSPENRDLALSFASQAAVALDNKRLIDSIQTLFEGFVTASVQAIESRDPTTSGHSGRVAVLTVGLAQAVNEVGVGQFEDTHFTPEDLKEIRYASLLHDFGKVGVREHVLIKAKKLYDWQIEQIRARFGVARTALEAQFLKRKLDELLLHGTDGFEKSLAAIDEEYAREAAQLDEYYQLIKQVNEPTVLEDNSFEQLLAVSSLTYATPDAGEEPLVESAELKKLSIKRGSLDDNERREIESHVTHTYKFLTKIPWTRELQRVPEVAWAHHEKLDGSGYPNALTSDQIPLQSKMMTISDIYDALTAWDRPYKKAVPVDKALQILGWEMKDGHIDAELLDIFIQKGVYNLSRTYQP